MKLKKETRAAVNNADSKGYYAAIGIRFNGYDDKRRNLLSKVAKVKRYSNDNYVYLYDASGKLLDSVHRRDAWIYE